MIKYVFFLRVTRLSVSAGCGLVRVLTPALPLLSHWQTRISFPGEQWAMALKDPSLGNIIKELEKWNKWKRLLAEQKLPCSRLCLHPMKFTAAPDWIQGEEMFFPSICNDHWGTGAECLQLLLKKADWTGLSRTVGFYMGSARSFITAADADCFQQHGKEIKSRWKRPSCLAGG